VLVRGVPRLPDTFDEWEQSAAKIIEKLEAQGWVIRKTIIIPKEFAAWCKAGAARPNRMEALGDDLRLDLGYLHAVSHPQPAACDFGYDK
jgi:hypothetical protein